MKKRLITLAIILLCSSCTKKALLYNGKTVTCKIKYTSYGAIVTDSTNQEIPSYWIDKIIH